MMKVDCFGWKTFHNPAFRVLDYYRNYYYYYMGFTMMTVVNSGVNLNCGRLLQFKPKFVLDRIMYMFVCIYEGGILHNSYIPFLSVLSVWWLLPFPSIVRKKTRENETRFGDILRCLPSNSKLNDVFKYSREKTIWKAMWNHLVEPNGNNTNIDDSQWRLRLKLKIFFILNYSSLNTHQIIVLFQPIQCRHWNQITKRKVFEQI